MKEESKAEPVTRSLIETQNASTSAAASRDQSSTSASVTVNQNQQQQQNVILETMENPEEQEQQNAAAPARDSLIMLPQRLSLGNSNAFALPQLNASKNPAINEQVPAAQQLLQTGSGQVSIASTPTFMDSQESYGNQFLNFPMPQKSNIANQISRQSNLQPASAAPPTNKLTQHNSTSQTSHAGSSFGQSNNPSQFGLPTASENQPKIQINSPVLLLPQLQAPVQINIGNSGLQISNSEHVKPISSQFSEVSPDMAQISVQVQSMALPEPNIWASSLGDGLSIKINTDVPAQDSAMAFNQKITEKAGLNLEGLGSSDEELDEGSTGPNGGCTGEPQQYKQAIDFSKMDENRLIGQGNGIFHSEQMTRQDSQTSGMTSGSERSDGMNLLSRVKKTKSMMPSIGSQDQINTRFNETLPPQYQVHSLVGAQNKIEDLYDDLQKVVKIARGYREDFLALQSFIKNHFKSADILFKNSGFLTNSLSNGGNSGRMKNILESCFQETPMVAMAFASPLCYRVVDPKTQNERVEILPQLDFAKEFEGATQGIEETGNLINVQIVPATLEKFTNCLMQKPIGLHFTGHGMQNNFATIGQDSYLMQNQGNCLVFEKEDASAHLISQKRLKDLFEMQVASLKFVFIATCHSQFAGEIFHWAGVDHVICVKQGDTLLDEAAIFFARKFYQAIFMEKYTICESFKRAKTCLEAHESYQIAREAEKVILILDTDKVKQSADMNQNASKLPKRQTFGLAEPVITSQKKPAVQKKEHQCCVLGPFKKRDHELVEQKSTYPFSVAKISEFVGRQQEMQEIISCVLQNRLTTVLGVPGIGKTTISKSIGFHLSERKTFHDGIMFFTLRGKDQTTALISMLFLFLQKHDTKFAEQSSEQKNPQSMLEKNRLLKQQQPQNGSNLPTTSEQSNAASTSRAPNFGGGEAVTRVDYKQDYLEMEEKIHEYLQTKQALIIIDNLEDVLREDENSLKRFLTELLEKLPGISILTTSRSKIQNLGEITECLYELQQLNNNFSIKLLEKKCLRKITEDEIKELFEVQTPTQIAFSTPFLGNNEEEKKSKQTSVKPKLRVEDHHLCLLLGGHPHAISLYAPFLQNNGRLADLYKMLLQMIDSEDFTSGMQTLDPTQSLKVSMDTSTLHLRQTCPEALNLFCLLGMLPGGVSEVDLPILWKNDQMAKLTLTLRRASLLVERFEDNSLTPGGSSARGQRVFYLLPFMNKYAQSLLSTFDRTRFHNLSATWLMNRCLQIFRTIKTDEWRGKFVYFKELLLQIETNVWACIYRICDMNRTSNENKKMMMSDDETIQHQQDMTGYASATDHYEEILLRNNISIRQGDSDFSGDEKSQKSKVSIFTASKQQQQPILIKPLEMQQQSTLPTSQQLIINRSNFSNSLQIAGLSFSSGLKNKLGNSLNSSSLISKPGSRKISSEEHDSKDHTDSKQDSSLNDRTSGSLIGNQIQEQIKDNSTAEIKEKPDHEDAPSDDCSNYDESEETQHNQKNVRFAFNSSAMSSFNRKNRREKVSGPNSVASFREKNNKSPFNLNLSQIDAIEKSDSINTSKNEPLIFSRGKQSIYVSKMSNNDTFGEGQNSVLGSIDQSAKDPIDDQSESSSLDDAQQKQEPKSGGLRKSHTQKFLHDGNMIELQESPADDLKRQSSTTDNLRDHHVKLEHNNQENSFKSDNYQQLHATRVKQISTEDVEKEDDNKKALELSFNINNTKKELQPSQLQPPDTDEQLLQICQTLSPIQHVFQQNDALDKFEEKKQANNDGVNDKSKLKTGFFYPNGNSQQVISSLKASAHAHFQIQKKSKAVMPGSMALSSPLETIQEKQELSNDSLLIVTYIGILVLNEKYSDAIRAIEIVQSSKPSDLLLQANLKRMNAISLFKTRSESGKKQKNREISKAYHEFEEAYQLFKEFGRKSQVDNMSNLGIAICLVGMAHIMDRNIWIFIDKKKNEDACLKKIEDKYEQALDIYKRRDHIGGAVYCLKELAKAKKKLRTPFNHLNQEAFKLQRQIRPNTDRETSDRVPSQLIYRNEGIEISLLTELIDLKQIQAPTTQSLLISSQTQQRQWQASTNLQSRQQQQTDNLRVPRHTQSSSTFKGTKANSPNQSYSNFDAHQGAKGSPTAKAKLDQVGKFGKSSRATEEKNSFGRKSNNKTFASQTRQNNEVPFKNTIMNRSNQTGESGNKIMQVTSQMSTSTDDSVQTSLKSRPFDIAQVKSNNFFSEQSQSENEGIQLSVLKRAQAKQQTSTSTSLNAEIKQKKKKKLAEICAEERETLELIPEDTPSARKKREDQLARKKREQLQIEKAKKGFEEKQLKKQEQLPRPSIKKSKAKMNGAFSNEQNEETKLNRSQLPTNQEASKQPKVSAIETQTLAAKKESGKIPSKINFDENNSPQQNFENAQKLDLDSEINFITDLQEFHAQQDDSSSVYTNQDQLLDSSFTTNEDRTRRPSMASNRPDQPANQTALKRPTNRQNMKPGRYDHVPARIQTFRIDTRQGTPAKMRDSIDNQTVKKEGSGHDLNTNPFSLADEANNDNLPVPHSSSSHLNSARNSFKSSTINNSQSNSNSIRQGQASMTMPSLNKKK